MRYNYINIAIWGKDMRAEYENEIKISMIGSDGGVGMAALIKRFVSNTFSNEQKWNGWNSQAQTNIEVGNQQWKVNIHRYKLAERFIDRMLTKGEALRGADILLVCFDLNNPQSFDNIKRYIEKINGFSKMYSKNIPIIIVGTKSDQENQAENAATVTRKQIDTLCNHYRVPFIKTSARDRIMVDQLFHVAARLAHQVQTKVVETRLREDEDRLEKNVPPKPSRLHEMINSEKWQDWQKKHNELQEFKSYLEGCGPREKFLISYHEVSDFVFAKYQEEHEATLQQVAAKKEAKKRQQAKIALRSKMQRHAAERQLLHMELTQPERFKEWRRQVSEQKRQNEEKLERARQQVEREAAELRAVDQAIEEEFQRIKAEREPKQTRDSGNEQLSIRERAKRFEEERKRDSEYRAEAERRIRERSQAPRQPKPSAPPKSPDLGRKSKNKEQASAPPLSPEPKRKPKGKQQASEPPLSPKLGRKSSGKQQAEASPRSPELFPKSSGRQQPLAAPQQHEPVRQVAEIRADERMVSQVVMDNIERFDAPLQDFIRLCQQDGRRFTLRIDEIDLDGTVEAKLADKGCIDPLTHEVCDVPVRFNGHTYDLNRLLDMPRNANGTITDPISNTYEMHLDRLQPGWDQRDAIKTAVTAVEAELADAQAEQVPSPKRNG